MIISSQESYHQADSDTSTGQRLDFGLHNLEKGKAAKKNEGFFEKGLLKAMESEHRSGRNVTEVKAVGNGHAHCKRLGKTVKLICSELIGGNSDGKLPTCERCLVMLRWWRVGYMYR